MTSETLKDDSARQKLLWDLSIERRNQARHSENLRSSVAGYVMTAASALVAVVTYEDLDAASAGFRVGYEDPSYFSRDYKKLFGSPPQRDIVSLRTRLNT